MYYHRPKGLLYAYYVGFGVARSDEMGRPRPKDVGRVHKENPTFFYFIWIATKRFFYLPDSGFAGLIF